MGNYFISGNIILAVYKLFTACRNMIDAALTLTPLGTVFSLSTEIQSQVSLCVRLCWFSCCLWERSSYFILSSPQFQYFTSLRSYSKTLATLPLNLQSDLFSHFHPSHLLFGRYLQLQSPKHQSVAEYHSAPSLPCDLMLANSKLFLQEKLRDKILDLL